MQIIFTTGSSNWIMGFSPSWVIVMDSEKLLLWIVIFPIRSCKVVFGVISNTSVEVCMERVPLKAIQSVHSLSIVYSKSIFAKTSIIASPPAASISILDGVTVNAFRCFCVTVSFSLTAPHRNVNTALRSSVSLLSITVKVTSSPSFPLVIEGVHHDSSPTNCHWVSDSCVGMS